ncbi:VanZ family protein [Nucisporomicrobium flavum]|uniref:VanZ family protein n=1 Tax=Nucisporomicrobium flavum TaxID=2785915 RepID=UPI0018F5D4A8|nr:VanZ family protein [Nucisporomicrobium flavum]
MTTQSFITFISNPVPQVVFAIFLAVAWPLSRFAGRDRRRRIVAALFVASAGMIVALTATPSYADPASFAAIPPHFLTQLDEPRLILAKLIAAPSDMEQIANIALYVPLGVFGRLLLRSTTRATLAGFLLVFTIETIQYAIPGRAGSITDIRNNVLGTFLAAVATAAVVYLSRDDAERRSPVGQPR